jgi:hypothetical protein
VKTGTRMHPQCSQAPWYTQETEEALWASGVRSDFNSGQPVDHSGPGLSRAYNPSNTRSNSEGLPTNFWSANGLADGIDRTWVGPSPFGPDSFLSLKVGGGLGAEPPAAASAAAGVASLSGGEAPGGAPSCAR